MVVIGGLGSFWGVVLAALIVGVVRGLTVYFFPPAAEASMYVLMLLVLLFRPRGLRARRGWKARTTSWLTAMSWRTDWPVFVSVTVREMDCPTVTYEAFAGPAPITAADPASERPSVSAASTAAAFSP